MNMRMFREASIERLSSPEQLDQILRATSSKLWVALVAVLLFVAVSIVWLYTGTIVTTATGQGVVVRSGGVLNVVTRGGGVVLNLNVKPGDLVKANEVVATIAQPVLVEMVRQTREALEQALQEREHALNIQKESARLQLDAIERQRANAERRITELDQQATLQAERISTEEQLLEKGLVTKQHLLDLKQKVADIRDQVANLRAQIKQFDAQKFDLQSKPQVEDADTRARIANLRRDLAGREKELSLAETVVSPFDGQVLEVKVYPGSTVAAAQPVLSMQPDNENLEVIAYIPALQAKETSYGMEAQVSPSNIKREEYGFIRGEVVYVAAYPATPAALMRNFENESLVSALASSGPITEIRATLKKDRNSPTGMQWSTSHGPEALVSAGSICSVQIITRRQKPISLLLPYVKEKLGVG
jgi:HlyD family secretion protein